VQQVWPQTTDHQGSHGPRSPWLIAPGRTLDVPRLEGIPVHHDSFGADQAAARLASVLLKLDIAKPADWRICGGEPQAFVRRALDRFARSHSESKIDGAFELSITLSTDPHEWCEREGEPDGSQMFLYMEASSCGFVDLGPALALCEREHPRLPVTFARLFLGSIGSCFRIYDDRDAEEHISILEDNYDPQEDAEALAALPKRVDILPQCMKGKPLGQRALKSLLLTLSSKSDVGRLLAATLELSRLSRTVRLPDIPGPIREMFCDCNPPVPILLAIYRLGDAIEAAFDDERQSMLEATPEPWPLIPFNGSDLGSTRHAFGCLGAALDTLAAARRVLDLVPGWEPIKRSEEELS
jgi:hypothetical protein